MSSWKKRTQSPDRLVRCKEYFTKHNDRSEEERWRNAGAMFARPRRANNSEEGTRDVEEARKEGTAVSEQTPQALSITSVGESEQIESPRNTQ
jgi:hypothetical protein